MKKILFIFLISLFMIPSVYADVEIDPCYNDYLINLSWSDYYTQYDSSKDSWFISSYSNSSMFEGLQHLFPMEPGKTYYIKTFTGEKHGSPTTLYTTYRYDASKNFIKQTSVTFTINGDQLTYESLDNTAFISINPPNSFKSFLGTTIAFADFDLSTCPITEPEPEPIVPDTTLDNFYSIYVTKLKELSNFTIENKFILSAFVIILIFGLLASFIYLFFGRRKR